MSLAHAETSSTTLAAAPSGPDSLLWKYFGDSRLLLFLGRTGTLQNMHPAVGAALQDHSNFFDDPWDRLLRSLPAILGMIYDDDSEAQSGRVRDFHKNLKGTDSGGRRYHALNPDVFWWTHATFVETVITMNEHFGTPLTDSEKDQLIREGVTWWRTYGLSDRVAIDNYADFKQYWDETIANVLESNATTDFAMAIAFTRIPAPPGIPGVVWEAIRIPVMQANVWIGNSMLPPKCREILGQSWNPWDELLFRTFATGVRIVWPVLPERVRYMPRAYAGIKRVRAERAGR